MTNRHPLTILAVLLVAALTLACQIDRSETTLPTGPEPLCGDGVVEGAEQCDDGNTNPNDGCSNVCTVEARRQVSIVLSCMPLTGQPLAAGCTSTASSFASIYFYEWGDGSSTGGRSQGSAEHVYQAAGTYSVRATACEFEELDQFCGTDEAIVSVSEVQ